MPEVGQGHLAPRPVPVGVAAPGHVELVRPGERHPVGLLLQLVEDHPVVDAPDLEELARGAAAKQPAPFLHQLRRTDRLDAEELPGGDEVGDGLLMLGLEVDQHDRPGRLAAEDGLAEQLPGLRAGERGAAPAALHSGDGGELLAPGVGEEEHHRVAGRERLQLHHLALEAAVRRRGDGEVHLDAAGQRVHPRRAVAVRDGPLQLGEQLRPRELGDDLQGAAVERLAERRGDEEWRLGDPERHRPQGAGEPVEVPPVQRRGPGSIERVAWSGVHRRLAVTSPRVRRWRRGASFARSASRAACRGPTGRAGGGCPCWRGCRSDGASSPAARTHPARSRCTARCG